MQAEGGGGYYSVRRLQMKITFNSQQHQNMKRGKYQDEIIHLKKCVENRDDMANGLEEIFKDRAQEIDD